MTRILALIYGAVCYVIFFATFSYLIGFVEGLVVPKSVDSGVQGPFTASLIVNLVLLSIFGLQHSIMARPTFKAVWTQIVPKPVERSTYVLFSSLALILLFWQWRPITEPIWSVTNSIGFFFIKALSLLGFGIALLSTFLINHFDLFGLKQVFLYSKGEEHGEAAFRTPLLYQVVRHPLYFGMIVAFWATPVMTAGHLLFSLVTTAYILVAIRFEERNLVDLHGEKYVEYRERVSMIVPLPPKG